MRWLYAKIPGCGRHFEGKFCQLNIEHDLGNYFAACYLRVGFTLKFAICTCAVVIGIL